MWKDELNNSGAAVYLNAWIKMVCHSLYNLHYHCVCLHSNVRWCDVRAHIFSGVYAVELCTCDGTIDWPVKSRTCFNSMLNQIENFSIPFRSDCAFVYEYLLYVYSPHPHPYHSDSLCAVGGWWLFIGLPSCENASRNWWLVSMEFQCSRVQILQ